MEFKKYRKKPVIIEATQLTEVAFIQTLEGTMRGDPGDWLIVGVNGDTIHAKTRFFRRRMSR
jgi:hypothetical protein